MSSKVYYENCLACPHQKCKFKSQRFDSIEALNMHYSKTHSKTQKLQEIRDHRGRLRLVLRMK